MKSTATLAAMLPFTKASLAATEVVAPKKTAPNLPTMVEADGRLRLEFTEEQLVLAGGLQPSMPVMKSGDIVVQAQLPEKPVDTGRMHYPSALGTVVSCDGGQTWKRIPLKPGDNGLNMEGGIVQLHDGTILSLDTYLTPGKRPGEAIGQLYTSSDDWRTVKGPQDVSFDLPGSTYSSDYRTPRQTQLIRVRALRRFFLMTTLLGSVAASHGDTPRSGDLGGWKLLAPLPDRIGFGGMFAGVLNGRLVAAGGSQFPDKPLWLKGEKTFNDRIFLLAAPEGKWTEHATRLPAQVGGAASAMTPDAIYVAGGLNAVGCLRQVWEMRAKGDGFAFAALPDLPHAIGYGAAAIVGRRLYVVGGLDSPASKTPSVKVSSLDLDAPRASAAWRREPDLPGPGVFVCAAASDGKDLYVFGGIGFDAEGKAIPAKGAFRLSAGESKWTRLADLPEARVGISTPCPVVPGNKIFLIGGYADVFPGAPREHPGFSAQTLYFDLAGQCWEKGPLLPVTPVADRDSSGDVGPAPMIGAPCAVWQDHVVVIGGEVRSSVRTPAVLAWPLGRIATP